MRRFSQRNSLVTLNEINITPLLDLAFVLLIIFIITTPLLEQSLKLELPGVGRENTQVKKDDVRTIEVNSTGGYVMNGRAHSLEQMEAALKREFALNPKLTIYIRADRDQKYNYVANIIDVCERNNITRISFAGKPQKR
jgi:biopolymer transport protein ExbD